MDRRQSVHEFLNRCQKSAPDYRSHPRSDRRAGPCSGPVRRQADLDAAGRRRVERIGKDSATEVAVEFQIPLAMAYPFVLPPGVPADRVAAIRTATQNTFKDSAYREDVEKQGLAFSPRSAEEVTRYVE